MHASVGDRLHVHTSHVGVHDQWAEIVEVRGENGGPPFLVRYPDGREHLVFPGPDAVVEHAKGAPLGSDAAAQARKVHTREGW